VHPGCSGKFILKWTALGLSLPVLKRFKTGWIQSLGWRIIMKLRTRLKRSSKRSTSGFTLLEALVVLIIIGVLFAIIAPAWDTFVARQRISTARDQIVQVIQKAQSDAKRTNTARIIVFDNNGDAPRFASASYSSSATTPNNWQPIGDGNIKSGLIRISTNKPTGTLKDAIVFDSSGAIPLQLGDSETQSIPFKVKVTRAGVANPGIDRCVIIETLLGANRPDEGSACQ
jgi:prepilin-type N-terminal cleavage/methylation domain-containing protein